MSKKKHLHPLFDTKGTAIALALIAAIVSANGGQYSASVLCSWLRINCDSKQTSLWPFSQSTGEFPRTAPGDALAGGACTVTVAGVPVTNEASAVSIASYADGVRLSLNNCSDVSVAVDDVGNPSDVVGKLLQDGDSVISNGVGVSRTTEITDDGQTVDVIVARITEATGATGDVKLTVKELPYTIILTPPPYLMAAPLPSLPSPGDAITIEPPINGIVDLVQMPAAAEHDAAAIALPEPGCESKLPWLIAQCATQDVDVMFFAPGATPPTGIAPLINPIALPSSESPPYNVTDVPPFLPALPTSVGDQWGNEPFINTTAPVAGSQGTPGSTTPVTPPAVTVSSPGSTGTSASPVLQPVTDDTWWNSDDSWWGGNYSSPTVIAPDGGLVNPVVNPVINPLVNPLVNPVINPVINPIVDPLDYGWSWSEGSVGSEGFVMHNAGGLPTCSDGADNDNDDLIDGEDADCSESAALGAPSENRSRMWGLANDRHVQVPESCKDRSDNNRNNMADADDSLCVNLQPEPVMPGGI